MRAIRLLVVCLSIFLASCASMTPQETAPKNETVSWENRAKTISDFQTWDLKALIAMRRQNDAWSATLQWQQQHDRYHIALFGPLGTNSYEINGRPGNVVLSSANGKKASASNPETLLTQQVGWSVPVSNLFYWIRGLPVPNVPAQKQLDKYNHLISLQQQGWNIHYLSYTSVDHIDVPSKIFLDNPEMNVKIIINQWQL